MNRTAFYFALAALAGLSVFNYLNFPRCWRDKPVFRTSVIALFILGTYSLAGIMTVYRYLPYDWMKWAVSRWGTLYYVLTVNQSILFAVRILVRRVYIAIKKRNSEHITPTQRVFLLDKRVHSVVFASLSLALAVVGFINIGVLRVTQYDIHIDKPCSVDELNIVLVADIHAGAGTWSEAYSRLEQAINDAEPDVLLLAGDIFDETTSHQDVEYVKTLLKNVHPPMGTYYIYGNHDDFTLDASAEIMRSVGVTVLEDEMALLGDIQLIGRLDLKDGQEPLGELMDRLSPDLSKPVIMLTHRPKELRQISDAGCDLALAGHTHGLNIPQFMAVGMSSDMLYGLRQYGGMTAVVTSGVSAWGFHYKFPAISEIVKLHVTFK